MHPRNQQGSQGSNFQVIHGGKSQASCNDSARGTRRLNESRRGHRATLKTRSRSSFSRNQTDADRSVTIGQIQRSKRREQRRDSLRRAQTGHSKLEKIIFTVLAIVVIGALIWCILVNSSVCTISKVQVKGANHITNQEVSDMAQVPEDSSLLDIDTKGIISRLKQDPWVKDASVKKIFPSTLEIDITERTIQAIVVVPSSRDQSTQQWALSDDGIWLMQIPDQDTEAGKQLPQKIYSDAEQALHITDVPHDVSPDVGAKVQDASIQNALDIITGLTTSLSSDVKSISASSAQNAVLSLNNGVQIAFGSAEDIREKERVCQQLLSEHQGQISYINVRTVNRPTWRGLSS